MQQQVVFVVVSKLLQRTSILNLQYAIVNHLELKGERPTLQFNMEQPCFLK
jgi:hypothetical protein